MKQDPAATIVSFKVNQQFTLPSIPDSVHQAQESIWRILTESGFSEAFIMRIRMVIGESVTNAVEHGGGSSGKDSIRLTLSITGDSLQILVEDFQGRMFDPEYFRRIAAAKDWGKGGRGIMMLESLMDHVSYLIDEGSHTILFMEKRIFPGDLREKTEKSQ